MKKFFLLTRVLLKTGFGNGLYEDTGKKGHIKKSLVYIVLVICLLPFAGFMGYLGWQGYQLFAGLNTGIVLGLACYAGVLMSFFTGMTMCVGIFFNSGDTEFLLPMPLAAEQIVGAKFATMYVYTLYTELLFMLPVCTGYGIAMGAGVSYWLLMAVTALILPVTPLVYGSMLSMLLVRVFKRMRNKDVLTVMTSIFAFVLVLVINTFAGSMEGMENDEFLRVLLEKGSSIMEVMNNVFPNTALAERALATESPLMLLLFLLSAAAFTAVFILVAKYVYTKAVVEMSDANSKGRALTGAELKKAARRKSQIKSYVLKELRSVYRTPIWFMNCVLLSLIWPLILLIPTLMQQMNDSVREEAAIQTELFGITLKAMEKETMGGVCMLVVFGITMLAISFSMMNTTCISREGKSVFFMKYIPMSYERQLRAKIIPGLLLTLITGTLYSCLGMAFVVLILEIPIPPVAMLLSVIISVLSCIAFNTIDVISDIIAPKLEWETETAAVKQNVVAIIPMFLTIAMGILLGIGGAWLHMALHIPVYGVGVLAILLLAVLSVLFYKIDVRLANKYFAKY